MTKQRAVATALCVLTGYMGFAVNAFGQAFPARPVRVLVGFVPGGTTDTVARLLAQKLTESFGQSFFIETRPGAGGNIAVEQASKAPPDGHTLLVFSVSATVNHSLYKNLTFDVRKDLTPISQLVSAPHILVVHPTIPIKSVPELIQIAKKRPGQLNFANAGNGSTAHLAAALFAANVGIDIVHIPYKGAAPAMTDVLAGHAHAMFTDMIVGRPHVISGKLRALATSLTAGKRSALMPDLPALADGAVPGFESGTWIGFAGPAGLARPILERLNAEALRAFNAPDVRERTAALGLEVVASSAEAFGGTIRADVDRWTRIVKEAGISIN